MTRKRSWARACKYILRLGCAGAVIIVTIVVTLGLRHPIGVRIENAAQTVITQAEVRLSCGWVRNGSLSFSDIQPGKSGSVVFSGTDLILHEFSAIVGEKVVRLAYAEDVFAFGELVLRVRADGTIEVRERWRLW